MARARVSAHTIAEILNNFIEPISYKTMTFFAVMLLTVIVGSNIAFGIGRRTLSPDAYQQLAPLQPQQQLQHQMHHQLAPRH